LQLAASHSQALTAPTLRILVLGTRGPGCEGGIERHVEELIPLLAAEGHSIEVLGRATYRNTRYQWPAAVKVTWLWAPKTSWLETILHSFIGVLYAIIKRPDVLHIHAIGPALLTPVARLFGLRVVITHHGFDYDRERWGGFAKMMLRLGERFGMQFATERIVISRVIKDWVEERFHRPCWLIPNGVRFPDPAVSHEHICKLGLEKDRYVIQVSRCVPEKRQHDLIEAFLKAAIPGWKLVLVGGTREGDSYGDKLQAMAASSNNIVMAGFRSGEELHQLYSHAGIFVLPSSHEGLPIALLEALSYGLRSIVSDIPSNLEVDLAEKHYFHLGDTDELASKLVEFAAVPSTNEEREQRRQLVRDKYDWKPIAHQTLKVLKQAASG
jgi:glycosyltransferase involved in cell wall biosynthesis